MHSKKRYAILYLVSTLLLCPLLSANDSSQIKEAEFLEISGEPLSAEIEYISTLENNIKRYTANIDSSKFNLAECEFILEKILQLTKFTGDNKEALKAISRITQKCPNLPASFFSRLKLAEQTFNIRLGKIEESQKISQQLRFANQLLIEIPGKATLQPVKTIAADNAFPLGKIIGKEPTKKFNAILLISTSKDREVALSFGNSTPTRIFLNSQEIYNSSAKRKALPDQQKIGIKLSKGINKITFECQNELDTKIYARITETDGSPARKDIIYSDITELTDSDKLAQIADITTDNKKFYSISVDNGAEQLLAGIIDNDPKNHRASYYLGQLILNRFSLDGDIQPAKELLLNAARYNPENSSYLMAVAQAADESKRFKADQDNNIRRMSLEKAIQVNNNNIIARTELARYYLFSQNSPDRAEEYVKQALKINPISVQANLILYKIYQIRNWKAQALSIAQSIARRDPDIPQVQKTLAIALMNNSTVTDALHTFQIAYEKNMQDTQIAKNIIILLLRTGNPESAIRFAQKSINLHPYNLSLRKEMIEIMLLTKNPQTADEIAKAESIFFNNAEILKLHGKFYDIIENDHDKAMQYYRQALRISPADPELNNYFAFKGIKQPTPLTNIINLAEYVENSKVDNIFPNAESAYVLTEQYDKLNLDGTRSHSKHFIIKISTANAATQMKRYPIWFDKETETTQVVKATVLHKDGEKSLAQISDIPHPDGKGLTLLDFPVLQAGDILDIEFTINQIKPNFFGNYFGYIHYFKKSLPTIQARYILDVPKKQKLYFHNTGNTPDPEIKSTDNQTTYIWQLKNLPAVSDQPFSPPLNEISPAVEISTFKDWNELAKWYWQLVDKQNQPSTEIAAKVKELTFASKTERDKLSAIYNWITSEIRNNAWEFGVHGYKPYNATTIFNRKFGDCKDKATLLNVMAKLAGLDAWPLLLRSTQLRDKIVSRGKEDLSLPLLSHFNHCISYVIADDEAYFLDGTMQLRTIDSIPVTDAGAQAVIIRPNGAELTRTPAPSGNTNRWIDYTGIGINAEGTADIDFTVATTGESSMFLRAWFSNLTTWDNVLRAICSERYGHVSAVVVEDFGTNPTLDKDEVTLKGRVRIRNYANTTPNKKIVFSILEPFLSENNSGRGAFPAKISNLTISSKRNKDLLLPTLFKIERHIKIEWPERWKISEKLPAPLSIDKAFGKLEIKYEQINNTLKLDYVLELKQTRISTAEYQDFRKFCLKADLPTLTDFTLIPQE